MTLLDLKPGQHLGQSDWHTVTQTQIDQFARVTHDLDPMHIDPVWANQHSPYGKTISFGFLTSSLLTFFSHQVLDPIFAASEVKFGLNYGFDRLRIISPVLVNSQICGDFSFRKISTRADGGLQIDLDVQIKIKGQDKPALVAQWIFVSYTGESVPPTPNL